MAKIQFNREEFQFIAELCQCGHVVNLLMPFKTETYMCDVKGVSRTGPYISLYILEGISIRSLFWYEGSSIVANMTSILI